MVSKHFYITDHKGPICDFCGSANPTWAFDGPDPMAGDHGKLIIADNGTWASCEECAPMVEKQDVLGLVNRCSSRVQEIPSDILSMTLTIYFSRVLKTLGPKRRPNESERKSIGGMILSDEQPGEKA